MAAPCYPFIYISTAQSNSRLSFHITTCFTSIFLLFNMDIMPL